MDNLELLLEEVGVIDTHLVHLLVVAPSRIESGRDSYLALRVSRQVG